MSDPLLLMGTDVPSTTSTLPPIPTRAQVCGINLTFQGLTANTPSWGNLSVFEAVLPWLSPADRQAIYRAKRATGRDTHCMIGIPGGAPPYPVPPYDTMPALDWTNWGMGPMSPLFVALVTEVILEGFFPVIFCGEVETDSLAQIPLVMTALTTALIGDLTPYCVVYPGWDGVFYGWEGDPPPGIPLWAQKARAIAPNCYLGLHHNSGHIPVGGGRRDYEPGGQMDGYDVVSSEYDDSPEPYQGNDTIWQVTGRLIPNYKAPADMTNDTPHPPFYLVDSPRGPRYHCALEWNELWGEYRWSHILPGPAGDAERTALAPQIERHRQYFRDMGCLYVG